MVFCYFICYRTNHSFSPFRHSVASNSAPLLPVLRRFQAIQSTRMCQVNIFWSFPSQKFLSKLKSRDEFEGWLKKGKGKRRKKDKQFKNGIEEKKGKVRGWKNKKIINKCTGIKWGKLYLFVFLLMIIYHGIKENN